MGSSHIQTQPLSGFPPLGAASSYASGAPPPTIGYNDPWSMAMQPQASNIPGVQLDPNAFYDSRQPTMLSQSSQGLYVEPEYFTQPQGAHYHDQGLGTQHSSTRGPTSSLGRSPSMSRTASKQRTGNDLQADSPSASPYHASSSSSSSQGRGNAAHRSGRHHGPPLSPSASYSGYVPPGHSLGQGSSSMSDAPRLSTASRSSASTPQTAWPTPWSAAPGPSHSMASTSGAGVYAKPRRQASGFTVHAIPGVPPQDNYPLENQQLSGYPDLQEDWPDTKSKKSIFGIFKLDKDKKN